MGAELIGALELAASRVRAAAGSDMPWKLPQVTKHERALLGCALLDRRCLDDPKVVRVMSADFGRQDHARIWDAIRAAEVGDVLDVHRRLDNDRTPDRHRIQLSNLMALYDEVPTAANAPYYADQVLKVAAARRLWSAGQRISTRACALAHDDTPMALIEFAESCLDSVDALRGEDKLFWSATEVASEMLDRIMRIQAGEMSGITTGIPSLDGMMAGGFKPSELTLIAGRPSMGKTAFLANAVMRACDDGLRCGVFSIEVPRAQFLENMTCARAGVSRHDIERDRAGAGATRRFLDHADDTSRYQLWIDDRTDLTVEGLASAARRLVREHQVQLIAVDYAQILKTEKDFGSKPEQYDYIAHRLKRIARDLEIPMAVAAQLRRPTRNLGGRVPPPSLDELKGSGGFEEAADVAILLHRPDYYRENMRKSLLDEVLAYALVRKNRHGPTGPVRLRFNRPLMMFDQPDPDWKEEGEEEDEEPKKGKARKW